MLKSIAIATSLALLALGGGASLAPTPSLAAVPARLAQPERLTVTADGHPLRVWARRAAKPRGAVLFVHGRTWSGRPNFDLQTPDGSASILKQFADRGFDAYAVDLRGYGQTPRDASGWLTPNRAAADVAAVLDWIAAREHRKPVLVGYSNGSMVALLAAQTYPDSLGVLVLYGAPYDPAVKLGGQPAPPAPARAPTTLEAAASDFITPGAASPARIKAYAEQAVAADPVRVDWRNQDEFNLIDTAKIKTPTLLIQGVNDPNVHAGLAPAFFRLGATSKAWVTLPNADHAAHVETAQAAWVAAIIQFIERNQPHK